MSEGIQMALRAAMAGGSMHDITTNLGASLTVHDRDILSSITQDEITLLTELENKARITKGMAALDPNGGIYDGVWVGGIW